MSVYDKELKMVNSLLLVDLDYETSIMRNAYYYVAVSRLGASESAKHFLTGLRSTN